MNNTETILAVKLREAFGAWSDHPEYPPEDWREEIAAGDTRLGYWEWVAHKIVDSGVEVDPITPKIVLTLDGGLVQHVAADAPVEVLVLDVDTDGLVEEDLIDIKDQSGDDAKAYAHFDTADVDEKWVNEVHTTVKRAE